MTAHQSITFNTRLKRAVTESETTPLVFLGNFEVEERWASGECTLPRLAAPGGIAVVNRMDAFAILLGTAVDHVVLKSSPDPDHLSHLEGLGLDLPTVHAVADQDPLRVVTEDILADPAALQVLAGLGTSGAWLSAHGISDVEEQLARHTGLALAGPTAAVCKAVNSKVYSVRLAEQLGLRQPPSWTCTDLGELDSAVDAAAVLVEQGRPVVVKEAFGVSGKGMTVVDRVVRLRRLHRIIQERAERAGSDRAAFVLQEWVPKQTDINYQFLVSRNGRVEFDFVKEAVTEAGVHRGHRIPAQLPAADLDVLRDAAEALGKRLRADGYFGVVGVDAMVDLSGRLYPIIEINARNNMSTYQVPVQERALAPDQMMIAKHYPLTLTDPVPFAVLRRQLADLLLAQPGREGLVVANHATLNARPPSTDAFTGRLYALLVADSSSRLEALDGAVAARLGALDERQAAR
ncbi:MAG TPA: ATP-grasp domain-containing protein [Kineosporiaceae bacterium]